MTIRRMLARLRRRRSLKLLSPFLTVIVVWLVVHFGGSFFSQMFHKRALLKMIGDVLTRTGSRTKPLYRQDKSETAISNHLQTDKFITLQDISASAKTDSNTSPVRALKLVSGFRTDIILFSAIVGNSTSKKTWDKIAITGWEADRLEKQTYICCVAFLSGTIKSVPMTKQSGELRTWLVATQFMCSLNETNSSDILVAATITDAKKSVCHKYTAAYVDVEYAYAHPEEVAAFGKVAYGNVSARDLLTWIEIHRLQGVNKFFIYPYEIPSDAMKVLRYYQRQGLLDIIPYARHTTGAFKDVGWDQYHNDQHVTYLDGLERIRGYKYMVNFDIDEYIISKKGEPLITVFDKLFKEKPDGGAFWFQVYIFVKNWGATNFSSPFSVGRYSIRTDITSDRRKLVFDPSKIIGRLYTHYVSLKGGYETYRIEDEDAALYHFRDCRPEWLRKHAEFPCYTVRRTHDETVLNMFKKVEAEVMDVVTKLGI